jgi:hypothetical protein
MSTSTPTKETAMNTTTVDYGLYVRQAEANLEAARNHLTQAIANGEHAEMLVDRLNAVAEAEGALQAAGRAALAFGNGASDDRIRDGLIAMLLNSPDDTWSGRGNDMRRAKHDGLRKQVQQIIEFI